jgi:hypothetical protein
MAKKVIGSKSTKAAKKSEVRKSKPAQSKARNKGRAAGGGKTLRDDLVAQIHAMALTLDEDSLKSLLQDAAILAHNERVLRDYVVVKEKAGPRPPKVRAAIEEGRDGTYFVIVLNNYRNIMSMNEMRRLVRLCHGALNAGDGARMLYAWIERDRRDIKKNSKIADHTDPSLPDLWEKIVSSYTLKS